MVRNPARIVIADPQPRVRSALRLLLEQHFRLEVSGEAGSSEELLGLTQAACPDLLLLDWDLPGVEPARLLQLVRGLCPTAKVIVTAGRAEARGAAVAAGADVFVSKSDAPEGLMAAIRACSALRAGTSPTVAPKEAEHGSEIPGASLRSEDDQRPDQAGAVPERPGG